MSTTHVERLLGLRRTVLIPVTVLLLSFSQAARAQAPARRSADSSAPIHFVQTARDRVNMTVNSSLILALDENIPRVQVGHPELLTVTPLSARQIQLHAAKTGITQVSLWDAKNQIRTVDVAIYGDSRELDELLQTEFPGASIGVRPTAAGVILTGFVDRPEDVQRIVALAQDYFPKVLNNIRVGGAPQVMLHVKVMEISRTKLRDLGIDFNEVFKSGSGFFSSNVSGLSKVTGLPQSVANFSPPLAPITTTLSAVGAPTMSAGVVGNNNGFYLFTSALQQNNLAKLLAEPTLVTVSGRPAYFLSGGELPIPVPQSLGTVSIQYRRFGTQIDFVPIVLGEGRIRLEVRPKVSEIDYSIAATLNGSTIPGFRTREVDTGVEMMAGQTFVLAGLIQRTVESQKQGIPYLMDVPYLGVPFRRTKDTVNEVELLIMVRPELAEGLDCDQVPPVGPGGGTVIPSTNEMFWKGYFEVPAVGGPGPGPGGPGGPGPGHPPLDMGPEDVPPGPPAPPEMVPPAPAPTGAAVPQPSSARPMNKRASATAAVEAGPTENEKLHPTVVQPAASHGAGGGRHNRPAPQNRQNPAATKAESDPPAFLGPTGYDVLN